MLFRKSSLRCRYRSCCCCGSIRNVSREVGVRLRPCLVEIKLYYLHLPRVTSRNVVSVFFLLGIRRLVRNVQCNPWVAGVICTSAVEGPPSVDEAAATRHLGANRVIRMWVRMRLLPVSAARHHTCGASLVCKIAVKRPDDGNCVLDNVVEI